MTIAFAQDLDSVRDYYCRPRVVGGQSRTIYQIWESGGALDDSITPSTYCPHYQDHVLLKLASLTADRAGSVFSIGCGNAIVESLLADQGKTVRGIDCNEEAVALARSKRVEATVGDFMQLTEPVLEGVAVVYADGLVGHLFDVDAGLSHFFSKLRELGVGKGTYVLISNDAPRARASPFEQHPRVKDFWFVSPDFVADSLKEAGFAPIEVYTYPYLRPQSGLRHRTICVARA